MKTRGVVLLVFVAILVIAVGALIMNSRNSGIGQAVNTQPAQNPETSVSTPATSTPTSTEAQTPTTSTPEQTTTSPPSVKTYNVNIQYMVFSPDTLTINAGDTVIWTDLESMAHSITSDSGKELSSMTLGQGQSYLHTFTTAGTYSYHDSVEQYMKGTVIVQ